MQHQRYWNHALSKADCDLKGDGLKQGLLHGAVNSTYIVTDFLLDVIGTHHRQLDLSHDTFPIRVPEKYTTVNSTAFPYMYLKNTQQSTRQLSHTCTWKIHNSQLDTFPTRIPEKYTTINLTAFPYDDTCTSKIHNCQLDSFPINTTIKQLDTREMTKRSK